MATNDDPVEQFLARCEPGVSSSAERYRKLRGKLIRFFSWKRCEDPEGLADESIGRLVTNIYAGETIDKPSSYARGIALNVYKEHMRKVVRLKPLQVDWDVAIENIGVSQEDDAINECIAFCLDKLSDDKKRVLEQYYTDDGSREELAAGMGLTLAAVRIKIYRIKAELKDCYQKCIRSSSPD